MSTRTGAKAAANAAAQNLAPSTVERLLGGMHVEIFSDLVPVDTVLVHGNLASNNWWKPAVAIWQTHARLQPAHILRGRLILAEWRGCGKSAPPDTIDDLHPDKLAQDYIKLLHGLGVERANWIGHSTGGLIGLFALLQAPELFAKVVLLDPVGPQGLTIDPSVYTRFHEMSRDRRLLSIILHGTMRGVDPSSPFFETLLDDAAHVAPLNWEGVLKALSAVDIRDQLAQILQPTLVLHGRHDLVLPIEGSRDLAARLPHGVFQELPDQGHSANVESPKMFVDIASDFLFTQQRDAGATV